MAATLGIEAKHPSYSARSTQWKRCRDAVAGSDAVKDAGEAYLPKLTKQKVNDYKAYKQRAMWYGASERTLDGMTGLVFRKPPVIQNSPDERFEEFLAKVTRDGMPFHAFADGSFREILEVGRVGVLLDMPSSSATLNMPFLVMYRTEDIVSWLTVEGIPVNIVLRETTLEPKFDDPFQLEEVVRYRQLTIGVNPLIQDEDEDRRPRYLQIIWTRAKDAKGQPAFMPTSVIEPQRGGEPLDFIPFYSFPKGLNPIKPPLLNLVDVNFSHYRSSADLENGRHFCGLPVYYLLGVDDKEVVVGTTEAWTYESTDVEVGILEFTGKGLETLEKALEEKQRLMATLGARLLEEQKRAAEAAATVYIRQAGEQGTIQNFAMMASLGFSKLLQWAAWWMRTAEEPENEVTCRLNTDLIPTQMKADEALKYIEGHQRGAYGYETLYEILKKGELTRPGVSAEDERELVNAETIE